MYGIDEKCIQNFVRKPERRRLLARYRRGWWDNIKTDLNEIRWEGMNCIHQAQYMDH
jgi:hypothetical protein